MGGKGVGQTEVGLQMDDRDNRKGVGRKGMINVYKGMIMKTTECINKPNGVLKFHPRSRGSIYHHCWDRPSACQKLLEWCVGLKTEFDLTSLKF